MQFRRETEILPGGKARAKTPPEPVAHVDIVRITAIWRDCLGKSGGPFLFGRSPTMADAMFAPICSRFVTYDIALDGTCAAYRDAVLALPDVVEWAEQAAAEPQELVELEAEFGETAYARVDAPANREQKAKLGRLSPDDVAATELAGEAIVAKLTNAPGNDAPIGGLKVVTESAWFAARPSGTEDVYKIYAESFRGREHLALVQAEAKEVVDAVLA